MKCYFDTLTDTDDIVKDDLIEEAPKRGAIVQYPEGRTYGECFEDEKRSIRMINGRFIPTLRIKEKPFRMNRAEALAYYTQKLQKVWETIPRKNTSERAKFRY